MAASLGNSLKRSYKIISKNLVCEKANGWLLDNFYVIDKHYRACLKDKRALKCTGFYKTLQAYCQRNDYLSDPKGLCSFLVSQNKRYGYICLSSLKTLLSVCAINKIAWVLEYEKESFLLANSVKILISLSDPCYEDIIKSLWAPERALAKFEENYENFDAETKAAYRFSVAAHAEKRLISETEAAKELISEAKRKGCPLGSLLFKPSKTSALLWCVYIAVCFALLTVVSWMWLGWLTLLPVVHFFVAAASVADQLIPLSVRPYRAPRLELTSVPNHAKTLVAVATLMNGGEGDFKVFDSLLRFRYMNPDKNIYFCVLADFPDSKEQYHVSDNEIIRTAQLKIDELNQLHGNRFCLFFRERVYNESEMTYGGWERKRGAVCELVSHIVNGDKNEFYGGDFISEIKYILTLDSDTNLSVESVRELLSVALHPVNRPVIKNGRVVSGYGIIQPAVRTELSSAYKTGFARLTSGAGGADAYSTASFHRSQTLFGSGNFCGKGLIDVKAFYNLVNGKMPTGLVLSHDAVEGSILRTLCASDITLTDSTPGNTVSFFRRQHRWMRGDFQNLYFLKGRLLSVFSKWRLTLTFLRHLSPAFSVALIVAGGFSEGTNGLVTVLLAYSHLLLPCAVSFVLRAFTGARFGAVRFFSKAYSMLTQTAVRLFFEISSSARRGVLTLHAYFLALVRMFTRQKTLEWTTAAQTERLSSSLGKYVLDSIPSVVLGLFILIFANPPFIRLCGVFYFVYPLISAVLSKKLDGGISVRPSLTEEHKNVLLAHAKDMFGFYYDNVGEKTNHLPPDNIQFSPVYSVAMRTSPTNIGFYLVSLLGARDLEIIDSAQLFTRLDSSLNVIENLEKYHGNLYNWYDISSLSVIGDRFVSTVDSGNFLVMLVALKEGLNEYSREEPRLHEIVSRLKRLISETDLLPLYDKKRELFKIGINEKDPDAEIGCYDLLMSEARMTGYYAVATSAVSKKHWSKLGRTLSRRSGYMGMLSWSGTAFEYLMPQLFLPLYRDSFMYESLAFSLMIQKSQSSPWGISESGFYSFDSEMNYQYKANGIQALALRRISDGENIRSPYSAYLSLCMLGRTAVKNLQAFESRGMYGKYGLYEALDFNDNSGGVCVKSYMAHHVGMSFIAVINALKDDLFVKRFISDVRTLSATELLQEKIPVDAYVFEDEYKRVDSCRPIPRFNTDRTEKSNLDSPGAELLTRGDMTAVVSSNGHIALNCGERALCNTVFDKYSQAFGLSVVFSRNRKVYGCTPLFGGDINYSFERGNSFVSHIASSRDFSARVRYSMAKNCNCFIINTRGEALKKYDVSISFEPVLDSPKNFLSHISFSRLFVESEYDKTKRILYFHRRSRADGKHIFTLAIAPKDKDMSFSFVTTKEHLQTDNLDSPAFYGICETDDQTGECINPICVARCENAEGGRATFLITCGETKGECERNIRLARSEKAETALPEHNGIMSEMLPALLYGRGVNLRESFSNCNIGQLWSKSISGDYPLAVAELSKPALTRTEELIKAFMTFSQACIGCELIFLIADADKYNRPVERTVRECCKRLGAEKYIGRKRGIFFLSKNEINEEFYQTLRGSSHFYLDFDNESESVYNSGLSVSPWNIITEMDKKLPQVIPEKGLPAQKGYFLPEGFVVDKSNRFQSPYSFVLTGYRFSTVLTQKSLGYSFFDNARERRVCSFYGDAHVTENGERLFAVSGDKYYDLCALSEKVRYEKGRVVYEGELNGNSFSVTVVVSPKYPVKLIKVESANPVSVCFALKPVMGDSVFPVNGMEILSFEKGNNKSLLFKNPFGTTFPEGCGFGGVCGGRTDPAECCLWGEGTETLFFLGACQTEIGAKNVASAVNRSFFRAEAVKAEEFAQSLLPPISVKTGDERIDRMFNFFVPYQVSACRFYARGSFYQSGGAYGFRDQLQDSLALIYSNPSAVRTHLIRCCAHQYEDGTVMHWWHTRNFNKLNRGIKSKCSDDLLYLPLVVADYMEKTKDDSLLDVSVHYLSSPDLGSKSERYEQPMRSPERESVYDHCKRVFSAALKLGKHGLVLMGSCDWNDAFSLVGERGEGESVFSSLLYVLTANRFIPICESRGDFKTADRIRENAEKLKKAVEDHAFYGDRYARAICDDGTVLGTGDSEECKIDILSQAFAALSGLDDERTKISLETAFKGLYDEKNRIFKLFSPPFANGRARVGYIRGYVAGIRENGGQYSHGALWGALGYIRAGMPEKALKILDCVNPASREDSKALAKKYKAEPYVIAADVYHGKFGGRGGWSWYTGASSWYYKIMFEEVFGIKLMADKVLLSVKPLVPYEMEMTLGGTKLYITASKDFKETRLNGEKARFPVKLTDGEIRIEIPCQ